MASWQAQEAKTHFGALLERAEHDGPQIITRRGEERAVLLSIESYRALTYAPPGASSEEAPKQYADFKDWLLNGPKFDSFEISRDVDVSSDVKIDD